MKFNYDTLAPREQKLVKFGGIALVAILIFGVMFPLDSSVSQGAHADPRNSRTWSG